VLNYIYGGMEEKNEIGEKQQKCTTLQALEDYDRFFV